MQPSKKQRSKPKPDPYTRLPELTIGRVTLWPGDSIRVYDAPGSPAMRGVYAFQEVVTEPVTGNQWVNLIGPVGNPRQRSIPVERVKLIPKPRRRKKC